MFSTGRLTSAEDISALLVKQSFADVALLMGEAFWYYSEPEFLSDCFS